MVRFYYKTLILDVPYSVYYPAEDSILLASALDENLSGKKALDVGCGSGFLSILMAKRGAAVSATDIDSDAVMAAEKNAERNHAPIKLVMADLFPPGKEKFDLIVFNPPYLPEDAEEHIKYIKKKHQIHGGTTGRETIKRFLRAAHQRIKRKGKILFVASSLTGIEELLGLCRFYKYAASIKMRKKIEWEELVVIEANNL
jgi:release factor glutamine methyltransferase